MSFARVSSAAAVLCAALFAALLLWPAPIYWLFDVAQSPEADFMARRAGMLFLGLAVLCIAAREAEASQARRAIATGLAVMMAAVGLVGLYELLRGFAGVGIVLAIAVEFGFAAAFWRVR